MIVDVSEKASELEAEQANEESKLCASEKVLAISV